MASGTLVSKIQPQPLIIESLPQLIKNIIIINKLNLRMSFKCRDIECAEKFKSYRARLNHERKFHDIKDQKIFQCTIRKCKHTSPKAAKMCDYRNPKSEQS
jgi:hypothetical protein